MFIKFTARQISQDNISGKNTPGMNIFTDISYVHLVSKKITFCTFDSCERRYVLMGNTWGEFYSPFPVQFLLIHSILSILCIFF
jgi:hypothetical protein